MMDLGVDLYDPRTYLAGLPLEAFARLRRECPVYWQEERAILDWPAGRGYWAITRYADVELVNRNPRLFSSHLGATQIRDPKPEDLEFQRKMMLNLDPPAHSRLRRIVSKVFTPRNVARLEAGIRERARTAVERVAPIIGSGTVSNEDRSVGVSCLAERRMIETIETGEPHTPFLRFGDRVRIEMLDAAGRSIFGAIEQARSEGLQTAGFGLQEEPSRSFWS